jgi:hypothetical protein
MLKPGTHSCTGETAEGGGTAAEDVTDVSGEGVVDVLEKTEPVVKTEADMVDRDPGADVVDRDPKKAKVNKPLIVVVLATVVER